MAILDRVYAYGHNNILCTHNTTIEITKEDTLTERGNCILGVKSSKACSTLNSNLKKQLKLGKKIKVTIRVDDDFDTFFGFGDDSLTLTSTKDLVFRKSDFISDRTVLIKCSKSSMELNRDLINALKVMDKKFEIIFELNETDE